MAQVNHLAIHSLLCFPGTVDSDFVHSVPRGLLAELCEPNTTNNVQDRKTYTV